MEQLWSDLGVAGDAVHVSSDRLLKIYRDCMMTVEQQCLADLEELLLERHDIFDRNLNGEVDMIARVSEELKVRTVIFSISIIFLFGNLWNALMLLE